MHDLCVYIYTCTRVYIYIHKRACMHNIYTYTLYTYNVYHIHIHYMHTCVHIKSISIYMLACTCIQNLYTYIHIPEKDCISVIFTGACSEYTTVL